MRKLISAFLACAMALTLAACGGSAAASKPSAPAAEQEKSLKKLDIVLDWYPNAVHTFLYEAQMNGYFAEEGIELNIISPADSVDAITFVAAGRAQLGLSYPIDVITAAKSEGMPVRCIGAVSQDSLSCMCALKGSGITDDLATLKGKKVGYSGTIAGVAELSTMISNAGLTENDYELINVGFDLVTSLTTGAVDFVEGTFINDEVVTMRHAGYDVDIWHYDDYGVPRSYGLIIVANTDAIAQEPELYEGFLKACRRGFEDMCADEDAALEVIMTQMNSDDNPLDEAQQRESYEILLPLMGAEDGSFLTMTEERWQASIDWMADADIIEGSFPAAEVADFRTFS